MRCGEIKCNELHHHHLHHNSRSFSFNQNMSILKKKSRPNADKEQNAASEQLCEPNVDCELVEHFAPLFEVRLVICSLCISGWHCKTKEKKYEISLARLNFTRRMHVFTCSSFSIHHVCLVCVCVVFFCFIFLCCEFFLLLFFFQYYLVNSIGFVYKCKMFFFLFHFFFFFN